MSESTRAEQHAEELTRQLRQEVDGLKSCFTQHTDQAVRFATAALPIIVAASHFEPLVAPTAVLVTLALFGVSRTGIYKYTSANRAMGYQLHLARGRRLYRKRQELLTRIQTVDWEEACRAWRIVQPAIFSTVYRTREYSLGRLWMWNHFHPTLYSRRKDIDKAGYPWYFPKDLTKMEGKRALLGPDSVLDAGSKTYHAGTYLRNAQERLLLLQVFSLSPLVIATQLESAATHTLQWLPTALWWMFGGGLILVSLRALLTYRRVRILEGELGSIHSCAIVWHAVIIGHLLVYQESEWQKYTRKMAAHARDIVKSGIGDIHTWISGRECELDNTTA